MAKRSLHFKVSVKFCLSTAQRKIELSGEAYFEVAKNKTHPFIVVSNEQLVEVLGTHFNISNYTDEGSIKTTLLEGSLIVTSSRGKRSGEGSLGHATSRDLSYRRDDVILKPGQQSTFTHNKPIEVKQVDASDVIAWKDGKFAFRNESLESIMRKVARWYDVEIEYQNNQIGKEILGGSFTRSEQISTILTTLELASDVHFKIQGKKVIITK
ncbi:FecR family protein [Pedobacter panaciterrae]